MTKNNATLKSQIQLSPKQLIQAALARKEGVLCTNGAFVVNTGVRTGRSTKDKFIVKDTITADAVAWGALNQPMLPEHFQSLWGKATHYLADKENFISQLKIGADSQYALSITLVTELAWQNLFGTRLFIRDNTENTDQNKNWTVLAVPGLNTDPHTDHVNSDACLVLDFTARRVLLMGMHYAGEIKKAMFSVMNFLLPTQDVLPMHCSANLGKDGDTALFFGLSGTGKTTLSADPERLLIGDDEHGWSAEGVFNFEGGCYAKCINLSQKDEPIIWAAIRDEAIIENVVLDKVTGEPRYEDASLTENTRAAYPLEHIPLRVLENKAGHPTAVIFLTCDLYGVLPPVALLTHEQAAYYFLSGYTALIGSTEMGSTSAIKPTFSTCFGAPFFPRPPIVYANLLIKRLQETNGQVYLVNTGWTGGCYGGQGKRFDIPTTRHLITEILQGHLLLAPKTVLPFFNFTIPTTLSGIDNHLLNPQQTWHESIPYEEQANILIAQFQENFKRFDVSDKIRLAGPSFSV